MNKKWKWIFLVILNYYLSRRQNPYLLFPSHRVFGKVKRSIDLIKNEIKVPSIQFHSIMRESSSMIVSKFFIVMWLFIQLLILNVCEVSIDVVSFWVHKKQTNIPSHWQKKRKSPYNDVHRRNACNTHDVYEIVNCFAWTDLHQHLKKAENQTSKAQPSTSGVKEKVVAQINLKYRATNKKILFKNDCESCRSTLEFVTPLT